MCQCANVPTLWYLFIDDTWHEGGPGLLKVTYVKISISKEQYNQVRYKRCIRRIQAGRFNSSLYKDSKLDHSKESIRPSSNRRKYIRKGSLGSSIFRKQSIHSRIPEVHPIQTSLAKKQTASYLSKPAVYIQESIPIQAKKVLAIQAQEVELQAKILREERKHKAIFQTWYNLQLLAYNNSECTEDALESENEDISGRGTIEPGGSMEDLQSEDELDE